MRDNRRQTREDRVTQPLDAGRLSFGNISKMLKQNYIRVLNQIDFYFCAYFLICSLFYSNKSLEKFKNAELRMILIGRMKEQMRTLGQNQPCTLLNLQICLGHLLI